MNWNRWSAFFCLAGLALFVPAVFVPAMLVANAIDGPRWYSVWGGIREFYRSGEFFLAGLIASFSIVFPLIKFLLILACAAGRHQLPPSVRQGVMTVTSWTAKYSMLDVMVIAMLILLVKVNEYVRILPSLGLYLFSAAILLSVLAGAALRRALTAEQKQKLETTGRRVFVRAPGWLVCLVLAAGVTAHAVWKIRETNGGEIQSVALSRLTHRGELRRSVEKTLALKELAREEHDFFSKDTVKLLMEFGQAVTTDAGWKNPEAWVVVETTDGREIRSSSISPVDLDDPQISLTFPLPEPVAARDIAALRLVSNIVVAKVIKAPIDEEILRRDSDPFREWTRVWHGRIFSLKLQGPPPPGWSRLLLQLAAGITGCLWFLAALITSSRPQVPAAGTPKAG